MKTSQLAILKICLLIFLIPYATPAQNWGPATPFPDPNGPVWCMAEMNNELYVGGDFTMIGGVVANHIAKWNGSSWSAVGSGTTDPITCMITFNGKLYAGHGFYGPYAGMNIWDGITWQQTMSQQRVDDFCMYNGQILAVISGTLYTSSGQSWSQFGSSFGGTRVCIFNNEVYVANTSNNIGNGIAKWNGSSWVDVTGAVTSSPIIHTMEVFNNKLIVGGQINSLGGITIYNIAQFDGLSWTNVGFQSGGPPGPSPGAVIDLMSYGQYLYMYSHTGILNSTTLQYNSVTRWDGNQWVTIGLNLASASYTGFFLGDLLFYSNSLFVGGLLYAVNSQNPSLTVPNLSSYNGSLANVTELYKVVCNVFPNPAHDNLTVTWSQPNIKTLTLTDAAGRAVRTYSVTGTQAQLSLEGLASGVYFLSGDGEEKVVQRIIKQ